MACPFAPSPSVVVVLTNPYHCGALLLNPDEGVLDCADSSSRQGALAEGLSSPKEVVLHEFCAESCTGHAALQVETM